MLHDIEVDQSGRTDRLNEDTVVAFSDGIRHSVLITAAVKRGCYFKLRERKMSKKVAVVTLFAAGLVILLQGRGKEMETICIDMEYPGWEGEILQQLLRRLRWLRKSQIRFGQIGKKSHAHDLAWSTFRRKRVADKRVSTEELLRVC